MALTPMQAMILALGPTSYYPLNDASTAAIQDISGHGHNATAVGAAVSVGGVVPPGGTGTMAFAGGSTGFIALPANAWDGGARTWIAFLNLPATNGQATNQFWRVTSSANGTWRITSAGLLSYDDAGGNFQGASPSLFGARHMVGMTVDASGNGVLYIDGVSVMTRTGVGTVTSTGPEIGNAATTSPIGLVDNCASFSFPLTAAQMAAIWAASSVASRGFFDIFASS